MLEINLYANQRFNRNNIIIKIVFTAQILANIFFILYIKIEERATTIYNFKKYNAAIQVYVLKLYKEFLHRNKK